jgi:putative nucleotidyltransferase with HDIG domain
MLTAFVLVSALLLAAAALVLGGVLAGAVREQAVEDAKTSLFQYANGALRRHLVHGGGLMLGADVPAIVESDLNGRPDILSVKVWRPDGTLVWTSVAKDRIGRRFEPAHHLREVLDTGVAEAELETLDEAEHAGEVSAGVRRALEVYAPILGRGDEVVGAYEIYADAAPIEASIARNKQTVWAATLGVFFAVWALLALLVRGASARIRRQTRALEQRSEELLDSYRRLEQSSLEAIESLNATVEAKDPYTAGHSLRVQRIAVALAEQLGLERGRLEAVRLGGLFHDIGKIAVPDGILTKPAKLTFWEFAQMKLHSVEGARIVGKIGRLREAVPVIRHHHERWDGTGYPDGLAADEIPLEAAIVGLADAWDAMTTNRPYARALSTEEAIAELRAGRGTQFAPATVDAFFRALETRPGDLVADAAEPAAAR